RSEETDTERWRTAPVTCSLTGEDIVEQARQWQRLLSDAECTEIDDGLRLTVPVERAGKIAALGTVEQQCCPLFDLRLHLDDPVVCLEVRAPADGAMLLTELFTPTI